MNLIIYKIFSFNEARKQLSQIKFPLNTIVLIVDMQKSNLINSTLNYIYYIITIFKCFEGNQRFAFHIIHFFGTYSILMSNNDVHFTHKLLS